MTPQPTPATALDQLTATFTHSNLLAGASGTGNGTRTVLLIALVWAVLYVLHCVIWPFRACRTCHGSGRSLAPNGKAWRLCRACKGSPARLRFGRRIYDSLRTFKDR